MTFAEEQEQEEREELYYVKLYNERNRIAKWEQRKAIAKKITAIAKTMGIQADDDIGDVVTEILKRLDRVDEFLKLETE